MAIVTDPVHTRASDRTGRAAFGLVIGLLALIPVLVAPYPPSTDLPQHLAQIRLLHAALADPSGPYVIQWAGPGNLIYGVLAGLWAVLPQDLVPRAAIGLIILAWLAAICWLAVARGRSEASAIAASLLVLNQSLYWGFLNFLIGFPVFVLWFAMTARDDARVSWKRWLAIAGTALLLYESHALWFAAGGVWIIAIGLVKKAPLRVFILRATALLPGGVIAALWYPTLSSARAAAGFDVAAHWAPLFDRAASFLDSAFGGVRGPVETVAFVLIYLWIGTSIWQNRKRLGAASDIGMLAAALFFLAVVLVAPDKYMNTIFFSSRWVPVATVFGLLALPCPRLGRFSARTAATIGAAAFFLITAWAWHRFDSSDLSGFKESLARIPAASRVLGLDLVKDSEIIKGRPFLQLAAYAQAFKGCDINFSFAEHHSGLVAFRTRRDAPWTQGLEWYAEKVQRSDFRFFDFVLVNGEDNGFRVLDGFNELAAVTKGLPWRLYRVVSNGDALTE